MSKSTHPNYRILYVKDKAGNPVYNWIANQSEDKLTLVVSDTDEHEYEISIKAYHKNTNIHHDSKKIRKTI